MENVIVAPELWSTSLLPEGILERWRLRTGAPVAAGQPVAEVRIGDDLHEILAPADGVLVAHAPVNEVVEPGEAIGFIAPRHSH